MDSKEKLAKHFQRKVVAKIDSLCCVIGGRSHRTVFRYLDELEYLTSYTHAGRYYTLPGLAEFNQNGLWFHRNIGFSRAGTLKQTVALQVEQSAEGRTHDELQSLLRVRVHNTLLDLLRHRRIGREHLQRVYLYVNADPKQAAAQIEKRKELSAALAEILRVATDEEVVEILVEALRAAPEVPPPALVAQRLVARGVRLEPHHVEQVYEEHGLVPGKKKARDSSRPSRR